MIFCRKCGRYSADGIQACTACGADLKTDGHATFQGSAIKVTASSKGTATAAAVAVAPAPVAVETASTAAEGAPETALYGRDKFLLRQKALAINEKYYVTDENGKPIVFVERPALLMQQIIMLAAVAAVFFGGSFVITVLTGYFGPVMGATVTRVVGLAGFLAVLGLSGLTFVALVPRRHVTFYADDTKSKKLLEIKQLNKIEFPYANFDIFDEAGNPLGKLRKNVLFDYIRRRWYCTNANGLQLFIAKEDSIILSLLRRTGIPIFAFMRTNFIFLRGEDVIGEFNRKLTILDRYVLDMTADSQRSVDRRIALAMGVMLDTGEHR
jgi:uncharacterized protein YxjI